MTAPKLTEAQRACLASAVRNGNGVVRITGRGPGARTMQSLISAKLFEVFTVPVSEYIRVTYARITDAGRAALRGDK